MQYVSCKTIAQKLFCLRQAFLLTRILLPALCVHMDVHTVAYARVRIRTSFDNHLLALAFPALSKSIISSYIFVHNLVYFPVRLRGFYDAFFFSFFLPCSVYRSFSFCFVYMYIRAYEYNGILSRRFV